MKAHNFLQLANVLGVAQIVQQSCLLIETMVITTLLALVVASDSWKWSRPVVFTLAALFLTVDLAFFGANVLKIPHGGWFPLALGALLYLLMATWRRGREVLTNHLIRASACLEREACRFQEGTWMTVRFWPGTLCRGLRIGAPSRSGIWLIAANR